MCTYTKIGTKRPRKDILYLVKTTAVESSTIQGQDILRPRFRIHPDLFDAFALDVYNNAIINISVDTLEVERAAAAGGGGGGTLK